MGKKRDAPYHDLPSKRWVGGKNEQERIRSKCNIDKNGQPRNSSNKSALVLDPFQHTFYLHRYIVAWSQSSLCHVPQPCRAGSLVGILLQLACLGSLIFVLCLLFGRSHRWTHTSRNSFLCLDLFKVLHNYCQLIHCFFKYGQ